MSRYPFRPVLRLVYSAPWYRWLTFDGWAWIATAGFTIGVFFFIWLTSP